MNKKSDIARSYLIDLSTKLNCMNHKKEAREVLDISIKLAKIDTPLVAAAVKKLFNILLAFISKKPGIRLGDASIEDGEIIIFDPANEDNRADVKFKFLDDRKKIQIYVNDAPYGDTIDLEALGEKSDPFVGQYKPFREAVRLFGGLVDHLQNMFKSKPTPQSTIN